MSYDWLPVEIPDKPGPPRCLGCGEVLRDRRPDESVYDRLHRPGHCLQVLRERIDALERVSDARGTP